MIYDDNLDITIKILDKNIIVKNYGKGLGYYFVKIDHFKIYSCYTFPKRDKSVLENILTEIENRKGGNEKPLLFNAISPQWSMTMKEDEW